VWLVLFALALSFCGSVARAGEVIRFSAFNVQNVTREDFADGQPSDKVGAVVGVISTIKPHVLLLSEVESGQRDGAVGSVAAMIAALVSESGWPMRAYAWPVNTGVHSGLDLDNNGVVDANSEGRDYGGDCLGYGEFPGQYGFALLVHESVGVDLEKVRTFKDLKWSAMFGALVPPADGSGEGSWYTDEELAALPLSSKTHVDVPVRLPDGRVVHVLASHPTPPVFDGPEDRNGRRNHDEIRFWSDYLATGKYITDDSGLWGPLPRGSAFVIMGDLNADPARGDSLDNPIAKWLLSNPRVQGDVVPRSVTAFRNLEPDMTAVWKMRVDYVLPSVGLEVVNAGVWRGAADTPPSVRGEGDENGAAVDPFPTDHFPVWVEVRAAAREEERAGVSDPIHDVLHASADGDLETVKRLVGQDPALARRLQAFERDGYSSKGASALHVAAYFGNEKIVQRLLDQGVNVDLRDASGHTPIFDAVTGHPRNLLAVRALAERGADLEASPIAGITPLLLAATAGRVDLVAELVSGGADLHARSDAGLGLYESAVVGGNGPPMLRALQQIVPIPPATDAPAMPTAVLVSRNIPALQWLTEEGFDWGKESAWHLWFWSTVRDCDCAMVVEVLSRGFDPTSLRTGTGLSVWDVAQQLPNSPCKDCILGALKAYLPAGPAPAPAAP